MLSRCKNLNQVFLDPSFILEKHLKPHMESLIQVRELEEKCLAAKFKTKSFDLFYHNMRAKGNFIEVENDPYAKQSSLVCLVQTCLNPKDRDFVWPDRNSMPHASAGNGKGIACFTDGKCETQFLNKLQVTEFQLVQMIFKKKYQIFVLYISPNVDQEVFEDVANTIEKLLLPGLSPILIGDTNFDSGIKNPLSNYLTNNLGLNQIITDPTFALGQNTIDHIYVKPDVEKHIKVDYRFNYYSDHLSFNLSFQNEGELENNDNDELF